MNKPNITLVSDDIGEAGELTIERIPQEHPATRVVDDLKGHADRISEDISSEQERFNAEVSDLDAFDREYETKRDLMVRNIGHRKASIAALNATFEHVTSSAIALESVINTPEADTERTAGRKVRAPRKRAVSK